MFFASSAIRPTLTKALAAKELVGNERRNSSRVRNRLQYERLYDLDGKFRPGVGSRAVTEQPSASPEGDSGTVRKRRVSGTENEE